MEKLLMNAAVRCSWTKIPLALLDCCARSRGLPACFLVFRVSGIKPKVQAALTLTAVRRT